MGNIWVLTSSFTTVKMKGVLKSIQAFTSIGLGLASLVPVEPLTSVVELSSVSYNDTACPESFIRPDHGEYCYYFSTGYDRPLNWIQALERCRNMVSGGTLVRPYDEMIDAFIRKTLREISEKEGQHESYWMDLNRILHTTCATDWSSAPWIYSDGSPASSFTNWWHGQPNRPDCEHCGEYFPNDDIKPLQWLWNDEACGLQWRYICQVKAQD